MARVTHSRSRATTIVRIISLSRARRSFHLCPTTILGASGPKMPSDYTLHAVFIRFATLAEAKIDAFLREPLVFLFPTLVGHISFVVL